MNIAARFFKKATPHAVNSLLSRISWQYEAMEQEERV